MEPVSVTFRIEVPDEIVTSVLAEYYSVDDDQIVRDESYVVVPRSLVNEAISMMHDRNGMDDIVEALLSCVEKSQ